MDKKQESIVQLLPLSQQQNNGSLLRMYQSEMFVSSLDMILCYICKNISNQQTGALDYLINQLYEKSYSEMAFYLPQFTYLVISYNIQSLDMFLLDKSSKNIAQYFQILWLLNGFGAAIKKDKQLERIEQLERFIEMSMVNGERRYGLLNNNDSSLDYMNDPDIQTKIMQKFKEKEARSNYNNQVIKFVNNLIKTSLQLKEYDIEVRDQKLREYQKKINQWLDQQRKKCYDPTNEFQTNLFEGIIFPFSSDSNQIVRIIYDMAICFNTKKRVPYKIVVETIDKDDLKYYKRVQIEEINTRYSSISYLGNNLSKPISPQNKKVNVNQNNISIQQDYNIMSDFKDVEEEFLERINKYTGIQAFAEMVEQLEEQHRQQLDNVEMTDKFDLKIRLQNKQIKSQIQKFDAITIKKQKQEIQIVQQSLELDPRQQFLYLDKKVYKHVRRNSLLERQKIAELRSERGASSKKILIKNINMDKNQGLVVHIQNKLKKEKNENYNIQIDYLHKQKYNLQQNHQNKQNRQFKKQQSSIQQISLIQHKLKLSYQKKMHNSQNNSFNQQNEQFSSQQRSQNEFSSQDINNNGNFDFVDKNSEMKQNEVQIQSSLRNSFCQQENGVSQINASNYQIDYQNFHQKIKKDSIDDLHQNVLKFGSWLEPWHFKQSIIKQNSPYQNFPSYQLRQLIVKGGDDLRQELIAMQIIKKVQEIFKNAHLNLYLRPYDITVTSANSGIIEFIPNTISIDGLKKKSVGLPLWQIYQQIFGISYEEAQKNFTESLAGYSLIQYYLNLKDRHNGNILIDNVGHIIHIDFGFIFQISPGGINFENAPFKLTSEYIDVMGGKESDMFGYFRVQLIKGFMEMRKRVESIEYLVKTMMYESDLPCFYNFDFQQFRARFMENSTDQEAMQHIDRLIDQSLDNWRTIQYDSFQRRSNGIMP